MRFRGFLDGLYEAAGYAAAFFMVGILLMVLAIYSVRLVWQSHTFNDISQGNDATPLWIPQIAMAAGVIVLLVAMVDDLVLLIRRRDVPTARKDELQLIE
jgi:TRAP-type C4-dicarboxylate transport system permease small subunit